MHPDMIKSHLEMIEMMLQDPTAQVTMLRGTNMSQEGPIEHHQPNEGKTIIIRVHGGARNEQLRTTGA